jgi:hypothetical protein
MSRLLHALPLLLAAWSLPASAADATEVTVYKSPTCGCCKLWVDHMRDAGFEVVSHDVANVTPVKQENGLPPRLASCHTALVGGYVIEGHVPAEDIARLLRDRPAVAGIAVPGMPMGSPGMEFGAPQPYDVVAFTKDGATMRYSSHNR